MPRTFSPSAIPRDIDPRISAILSHLDHAVRDLSTAAAKTSRGEISNGGSNDLGSMLIQLGAPPTGNTLFQASASLSTSSFDILGALSFTDPTDITKKAIFTLAGLTTGTTRSYAWPNSSGTVGLLGAIDHGTDLLGLADDDHTQYLLLAGRTGGQKIGSLAHTGGNPTDLAIEGRLLLGDTLTGVNFTAGRALDVRQTIVNGGTMVNLQPTLTGLSGAASSAITALQIIVAGTPAYTSGTFIARGMFFTATINVPAGVTLSDTVGAFFQAAIGAGTGTLGTGESLIARCLGPSTNTGGSTLSELGCVDGQIANRQGPTTLLYGFRANNGSGGTYASAVTDAVAFEVNSIFGASANVATWHGLRIPAISGPPQKWGLDIADIPNRITGPFALGWTPATNAVVTAKLHLGAGTATAGTAPLKLTSGTSLTAPEAGAIEFTTDDFFATITTGTARKAFVLDDGTRLTAGRVPFAGTNGRLIDDAAFLFAAGTGLTLSALNLITDTTTGLKIGTATNQKIGLWNTAPVIQPTTGIGAATFTANTSGIVDDSATFDGYTLGQVVKALRTIGVLA